MLNTYRSAISGGYAGIDPNRQASALQKRMELPGMRSQRATNQSIQGFVHRNIFNSPGMRTGQLMQRAERMKATSGVRRGEGIRNLYKLTKPIPISKTSLAYRGLRNNIQRASSMGGKALGSAFDFVAKRPKLMAAGIGVGATAALGFGISYGLASMSRARSKAPVLQTSAIRNTGQTNQYFNMGQDPFAGVRFASRRR